MHKFKNIIVHRFEPKHIFYLLFLLVLPIFHFKLFLLSAIIVLDMMYLRLRLTLGHDIPFDFHFLGMFINSYFGGIVYGLIFLAYAFVARLALGLQSPAHFSKQPIFVLFCIAASFFHSIEFTLLGICLYILRYVSEYLFSFVFTGTISLERIGFRLSNIATAVVAYMLIGNVLALF
ncbi:MAG: hypothetical protein HGA85_04360 [Nanoarchaeota archaeon]|nr:hypothetical protein [Nanoarchaeota archaeon]